MQALPSIPYAEAGPVSTRLLEELLPHARILRDGPAETIDDGAGVALLMILPGVIDELIKRRRAMDVISDMACLENVHFLHREEPSDG